MNPLKRLGAWGSRTLGWLPKEGTGPSASTVSGYRRYLGFVGAHSFLLGGAIGLLFLQRYIWVLRIAAQGYGPYQTVLYLEGVSAAMVLTDLLVLIWALKGSRTDRMISVLWPAFFFGTALIVLVANNW